MRLSKPAAFALFASVIVSFLAGSSAPTPLYAVYRAAWGFSPITITIVFGIYALAVLASLLVLGAVSDHVGRRPVLLVATLLQAAVMAMFATAHGVDMLIGARIIQGLATGAAVSAAGAGMLDLDRERGPIANSASPMLGTALGGIISGLFVQFLPAPTVLVYVVLAVVFVAQAIAVMLAPETAARTPGAFASMRPQLRVPTELRGAVLTAMPAIIGVWALAGFYGSLGPMLVKRLLESNAAALGGLALFVLAGSGLVTVLSSRKRDARATMQFGAIALVLGVAITLHSTSTSSIVELFAGTAIAGVGFGAGFNGAMRSVLALTGPRDRASVLSVLFVIAYIAMGVPAVFVGFRVVYGNNGIIGAAREYGLFVIALGIASLVGSLVTKRLQLQHGARP